MCVSGATSIEYYSVQDRLTHPPATEKIRPSGIQKESGRGQARVDDDHGKPFIQLCSCTIATSITCLFYYHTFSIIIQHIFYSFNTSFKEGDENRHESSTVSIAIMRR